MWWHKESPLSVSEQEVPGTALLQFPLLFGKTWREHSWVQVFQLATEDVDVLRSKAPDTPHLGDLGRIGTASGGPTLQPQPPQQPPQQWPQAEKRGRSISFESVGKKRLAHQIEFLKASMSWLNGNKLLQNQEHPMKYRIERCSSKRMGLSILLHQVICGLLESYSLGILIHW